MATKKPAKKRVARKARETCVEANRANHRTIAYDQELVIEALRRLGDAQRAGAGALPTDSRWVCERNGEPKLQVPAPAPEIHARLSGLASGQDRLQAAIEALADRLQCVMMKQPEPKPALASSSASDIGNKIEIASIRAHEAADLIESLTDCLGV